jgi:hypothetical protein
MNTLFKNSVSLLDTCKKSLLSQYHIDKIAIIDETNFDEILFVVKKEFKKQGIEPCEQYLQDGILALKQYYAIAIFDPHNMHAVSDELDPFWHAHVLFTKKYREFCFKTHGYTMEHNPLDPEKSEVIKMVKILYDYTSSIMPKIFDQYSPIFYPKFLDESRIICQHDCLSPEPPVHYAIFARNKELQEIHDYFDLNGF